jgi:hypothetical protein
MELTHLASMLAHWASDIPPSVAETGCMTANQTPFVGRYARHSRTTRTSFGISRPKELHGSILLSRPLIEALSELEK